MEPAQACYTEWFSLVAITARPARGAAKAGPSLQDLRLWLGFRGFRWLHSWRLPDEKSISVIVLSCLLVVVLRDCRLPSPLSTLVLLGA
jgi:hypothetical protein